MDVEESGHTNDVTFRRTDGQACGLRAHARMDGHMGEGDEEGDGSMGGVDERAGCKDAGNQQKKRSSK